MNTEICVSECSDSRDSSDSSACSDTSDSNDSSDSSDQNTCFTKKLFFFSKKQIFQHKQNVKEKYFTNKKISLENG